MNRNQNEEAVSLEMLANQLEESLPNSDVDEGIEVVSEDEAAATEDQERHDAEQAQEGAVEETPKPAFRKKTAEEQAAEPKKARIKNDDDDIGAVLELRATGLSYMKIEEKLGWKNSHGNRAWRICKDYALVVKETVN